MVLSEGVHSHPKCRRQVVSRLALLLTVFQLLIAQSHITQASDAALATLVKSVVTHELRDCLLVVMWDAAMKDSSVVAIVTAFPNVKQVIGLPLHSKVIIMSRFCHKYLLFIRLL
ncbi:hypothetical protein Pmani_017020 [Petrolisthes manimaculis]|uniref:Uncharacterized protein n=1 Tax=Petrolisthes manimaculis TaxID=1843537 RepID=A0AAE1PNH1_9EUCA|nr:hypothetical protein Pmani_017020 [Petrolisthes manimaculis]